MNTSPIQILDETVLNINVTTVFDESLVGKRKHTCLDFDKIKFLVKKGISRAENYWEGKELLQKDIASKTFAIHLALKNDPPDDKTEPYLFEVDVGVVVAVIAEHSKFKSSPEEMAYQYGLSFAFGIIRELIATNTARMPWGELLLPSMSFMDEKPKLTSLEVS